MRLSAQLMIFVGAIMTRISINFAKRLDLMMEGNNYSF